MRQWARSATASELPGVSIVSSSRSEGPSGGLPDALRSLGRIHHVAVVVRSIEDSLAFYRDLLRLKLETISEVPSDHVRIAFLGVGESKVELVEPTDDTTG